MKNEQGHRFPTSETRRAIATTRWLASENERSLHGWREFRNDLRHIGRADHPVIVMSGRRAFALGLAAVGCLILAWWALRSHEEAPVARTSSLAAEPAPDPAPVQVADKDPKTQPPAAALSGFRGRVIDAGTREPVREFQLKFAEWGRSSNQRTPGPQKFRTDDGRFEWQQLPPGHWMMVAEAVGYQPFLLDSVELLEGKTTAEAVLPLIRGYVLRGRVYDLASNTAIASAYVTYHPAGEGFFQGNFRLRPNTQSGKDGTFILNGLPPGRITLDVSARNYAARELDLTVDDDTAPLEVGLSGGGSISGRITASDGVTSVAGWAGLYHLTGSTKSSGGEGRTNEAGEFSFDSLAPGNYRVTGRGPAGSASRELTIAEGERIEGLILALRGGGTIRGTVTGLRPEDMKRLSITLTAESEMGPGSEATIDERGEYELRNARPGRGRLAANVNMRKQLARMIDVPANTDMTVDFDFPRGARVSGRVTQRGRPVAGAWLDPRPTEQREDFHMYGAATSQTGHYVLDDVPPGEYQIWIDGYRSRPFQVSGDTVFDIDASPQLAGRILEDDGKVPIAEAALAVWPADPKTSKSRALDRSDNYGRFAMAGLEPRDFVMTVYKPGYALYRERIAFAAPILDMTIRLRRDAGVEVRAHDAATGKPLQKLTASEIRGERPTFQVAVPLDEDGTGYIPGGLAGATVDFWAEGYATQSVREWDGERLNLKFVREPR
jgi:carboxypeptidase family protein